MTAIRDQRILVTGAYSGIGRAIAEEAGRRGAQVILVARQEAPLQRLVATLHRDKRRAVMFRADLSDAKAVQSVATRIQREVGVPDIIIHSAGAGAWKYMDETDTLKLAPNAGRRQRKIDFAAHKCLITVVDSEGTAR